MNKFRFFVKCIFASCEPSRMIDYFVILFNFHAAFTVCDEYEAKRNDIRFEVNILLGFECSFFLAGGYYGHGAPVVSAGYGGYGVSKVVSPYGVAPSVYGGYGVAAAPVGWYFSFEYRYIFISPFYDFISLQIHNSNGIPFKFCAKFLKNAFFYFYLIVRNEKLATVSKVVSPYGLAPSVYGGYHGYAAPPVGKRRKNIFNLFDQLNPNDLMK